MIQICNLRQILIKFKILNQIKKMLRTISKRSQITSIYGRGFAKTVSIVFNFYAISLKLLHLTKNHPFSPVQKLHKWRMGSIQGKQNDSNL